MKAYLLRSGQASCRRLFVVARQLSTMASPKHLSCPSENKLGDCPIIVYGDASKTPKAIIVLQEWWGVNQQIQDCAKEIADKTKMVTLIPDLYRGKVATDHETAGHYFGDLDWKGAVEDIHGCAKYLKSQGVKKVGVTGFCMGGALAMASAALVSEIDASAPFYGVPSSDLADVTKINVPLQCHFAEKDDYAVNGYYAGKVTQTDKSMFKFWRGLDSKLPGFTALYIGSGAPTANLMKEGRTVGFASPAEWKPLKTKLEESVKQLEFYVYDAGHAFTNKTGPNFNEELYKQAFSRMFAFFEKYLS